jgi:hypothetical protein
VYGVKSTQGYTLFPYLTLSKQPIGIIVDPSFERDRLIVTYNDATIDIYKYSTNELLETKTGFAFTIGFGVFAGSNSKIVFKTSQGIKVLDSTTFAVTNTIVPVGSITHISTDPFDSTKIWVANRTSTVTQYDISSGLVTKTVINTQADAAAYVNTFAVDPIAGRDRAIYCCPYNYQPYVISTSDGSFQKKLNTTCAGASTTFSPYKDTFLLTSVDLGSVICNNANDSLIASINTGPTYWSTVDALGDYLVAIQSNTTVMKIARL